MEAKPTYQPLVSVIITTYNHARYILKAIESVRQQTYPSVELIVIDDGSTDETASLVKELPGLKYVYQSNKGLPAARNAGFAQSTGEYTCFLDADDWLLPHALATNAAILEQRPELAFVAGAHQFYIEKNNEIRPVVKDPDTDFYCSLLEGNFIGMHATVMYRRRVFEEFSFDESLANCEDFDLYLQVVRKYPMFYHQEIVAVYRIHESNMTGNSRKMLEGAYRVYNKHLPFTRTAKERTCLEHGRQNFRDFYMAELEKSIYLRLYFTKAPITLDELLYLKKQSPEIYARLKSTSKNDLMKKPGQFQVSGWQKLLPKSILRRIL